MQGWLPLSRGASAWSLPRSLFPEALWPKRRESAVLRAIALICVGYHVWIPCPASGLLRPIRRIRSAFRLMKPWLTRSCSRPGVATSICTPRFSSSVCGFCPTPPKMTACLSPVYLPYALKDSPICMANSRVGVRMSALILLRLSVLYNFCKIGMENAAVLPVPVWAHPNKSFPWSNIGSIFPGLG